MARWAAWDDPCQHTVSTADPRVLCPSRIQILLLAVGANAVYTATRAIATARSRACTTLSQDVALQPALQPNPEDVRERQCLRLYLYSVPLMDMEGPSTSTGTSTGTSASAGSAGGRDGSSAGSTHGARELRVSKSTSPVSLAGSIASVLQAGDSGSVLAAGAVSTFK